MWADLADFLKANSTETFIISVIGTLLVWMYRCISFVYYVDRHIRETGSHSMDPN